MAKYLYNGIELPALPEWDKETYPYALIYKRYGAIYGAYICDLVAITNVTYAYMANGEWAVYVGDVDRLGWRVVADSEGNFPTDEWEVLETAWHGYASPTSITWANFDVLNEDGSVYLAASDPVPVILDPLPVSPYLPKNGAWVKHDVYKQVGNTWVKQPQVGYETQQGIWQAIFEQQLPEPEPEPEPEPIAYLYNGVQLPPFPERDESTYPYIVLGYNSSRDTSIVFFMKNSGSGSRLSSGDLTVNITSGNNVAYEYDSENNTWVSFTPNYFLGNSTTGSVFWSNYDVYVGTELALAASEPVPVYE